MAINYSLSKRKNPQKKDEPAKYYAVAQGKEALDLDKFAEHITSHGCVYSKGDILAILTIAIQCIKEQILAGNVVKLGDLGKFSCALSSRGASEVDTFIASANITKVRMKWQPSIYLRNLKGLAQFNLVMTKKDAAEAKAQAYGA